MMYGKTLLKIWNCEKSHSRLLFTDSCQEIVLDELNAYASFFFLDAFNTSEQLCTASF